MRGRAGEVGRGRQGGREAREIRTDSGSGGGEIVEGKRHKEKEMVL